MRADGREANELRPVTIEPGFIEYAEGSALIKCGNTWVLCNASLEAGAPPFVEEGFGWVTGEYAMLPRSTHTRSRRGPNGRSKEIQRLIGRSLRAAVDMKELGPHTITIDCDVLKADGGTRTASITGGYVALALAVHKLAKENDAYDPAKILNRPIAAVSVGIIDGTALLDLPYEEDSRADVDLNLVMAGSDNLIEIQGTAERAPFSRKELDAMVDLGGAGIAGLMKIQSDAIEKGLAR